MKKCEGCKFWSEMLAKVNSDNTAVEAMCLCESSHRYQRYTVLRQGCEFYAEGYPIDMPF
jgi:hypothetical protein